MFCNTCGKKLVEATFKRDNDHFVKCAKCIAKTPKSYCALGKVFEGPTAKEEAQKFLDDFKCAVAKRKRIAEEKEAFEKRLERKALEKKDEFLLKYKTLCLQYQLAIHESCGNCETDVPAIQVYYLEH